MNVAVRYHKKPEDVGLGEAVDTQPLIREGRDPLEGGEASAED